MKIEKRKLSDIRPYPGNPRKNDAAVDAVAESIRQCGYISPIIVDEEGVILAGHTRYKALKKLRRKQADVAIAEGLSEEQKRKFRLLDNKVGEIAEWDEDLLRIELGDLDFGQFDFNFPSFEMPETVTVQSYERRKAGDAQEGEEAEAEEAREAAAEEGLEEDSPEYQAFVEKFKPKKTTDDCYTPELVYDAVADFVAKRYGLDRSTFLRPFYPGGDYKKETYAPGAVVVDNPPFSILAEIVSWYEEHGIRFFLFAPTLTLFSSSSSSCTALPVGVTVTYANGAKVNTSFLTNLEPEELRVLVLPELYPIVRDADTENLREQKKELPRYSYPDEVLTAAMAARWCKYGVPFALSVAESERVGALDAQRAVGKAIYGNGFLMSRNKAAERAAAERVAAGRAAAERAAAERWELSAREQELVAGLSGEAVKL